MKANSKSIGNTFERKVAKELSLWIYDDPHVLKREPTSGATKDVYVGDIYPLKQLEEDQQDWVFTVECKYGYTSSTPTLLNFNIIEKWYLKALAESKQTEKQNIILLICNFKNKQGILVCTNVEVDTICFKCVLCIKNNGKFELVYCYDYKEMLKYYFVDIFSGEILNKFQIKS